MKAFLFSLILVAACQANQSVLDRVSAPAIASETTSDIMFADHKAYFESLTTREEKLAAIRMLDVEYVSVMFAHKDRVALIGIFMRDPDLAIRVRAAQAVGYNNCAETYAAELIQLVKEDPSPATVRIVAGAMSYSGNSGFFKPLQDLLSHPNLETRVFVAQQLMLVDHKPAVRFLAPMLKADNTSLVMDVMAALSAGTTTVGQELVEGQLQSPDAEIRTKAIELLGLFHENPRPAKLAPFLHDADARVRAAACGALAHHAAYASAVAELLNDPVADTRRAAIESLRVMRAVDYLPQIKDMQQDVDDRVSLRAKQAVYLLSEAG